MDKFSNLIATRRSMRKFTDEKLTEEQKKTILRAALISPTAKNNRGWEFVTVEDPAMLEALSSAAPWDQVSWPRPRLPLWCWVILQDGLLD